MVVDIDKIRDILSQVEDPEIPVLTIADLGVLRAINVEGDTIIITITPTYSGCPAMDMISVNIKAAMQDAGYHDIKINTVLSPPWTTDWITQEGREKLLAYGIVPPVESTSDTSFGSDDPKVIPCPICHSTHTSLISQFGSTACKALYKCDDCKEPFDYFKCH